MTFRLTAACSTAELRTPTKNLQTTLTFYSSITKRRTLAKGVSPRRANYMHCLSTVESILKGKANCSKNWSCRTTPYRRALRTICDTLQNSPLTRKGRYAFFTSADNIIFNSKSSSTTSVSGRDWLRYDAALLCCLNYKSRLYV